MLSTEYSLSLSGSQDLCASSPFRFEVLDQIYRALTVLGFMLTLLSLKARSGSVVDDVTRSLLCHSAAHL